MCNQQRIGKAVGKALNMLHNSQEASDIVKMIDRHTDPESGWVDIRAILADCNVTVRSADMAATMLVAKMTLSEDGMIEILTSQKHEFQEQNCAIAWIVADYLINPSLLKTRDLSCSVFELRDFRRQRHSRTMLLATRLMMTEDAINKVSELDNIAIQRKLIAFMIPEFANSAVKGHSVSFLLDNGIIR